MLQTALASSNSKLIRRKAQTWENVTSPNCETKEAIEKSYEWSHEFFPNLRASTCGSNTRDALTTRLDPQDYSTPTLRFLAHAFVCDHRRHARVRPNAARRL